MGTFVTILCDEVESYSTASMEEALGNLGVDVRKVHSFEEVDPTTDLVLVLHAERKGSSFNTYAMKEGITWLPVQFSHTIGRIGPIIIPEISACFECLKLRCDSDGVPPLVIKDTKFELSWTLISLITATETVKWVSRNTNSFEPLSLGHLIEFDAFHLQGEVNPICKLTTCPVCGARHKANLSAKLWQEVELVQQP